MVYGQVVMVPRVSRAPGRAVQDNSSPAAVLKHLSRLLARDALHAGNAGAFLAAMGVEAEEVSPPPHLHRSGAGFGAGFGG